MSATSYLGKKLVDHLTGAASYSAPTLYAALFLADPGIAGSLAQEVTGSGYARQSLAGKMGAADSITGMSFNTSTIIFGPSMAAWGFITFVGICDALSGGNVLDRGPSSTPRLIGIGQPFQIAPQNLKFFPQIS